MIASIRYGLACMPPSTPTSSVTLCPSVNRLTYWTTSFEPVEEEDDADQEQQVVVAGDHVLGAEVHQRADRGPVQPLQEHRILAGDAMRLRLTPRRQHHQQGCDNGRGATRSLPLYPIHVAIITGGVDLTAGVREWRPCSSRPQRPLLASRRSPAPAPS